MRLRTMIVVPIVAIVIVVVLFLATVGFRAAVPDVNLPDDSNNDGIPDDQQTNVTPKQPTAYGILHIPTVIGRDMTVAGGDGAHMGLYGYIGQYPPMPIVPISINDYVDLQTGQVFEWKQLRLINDGDGGTGGGGYFYDPMISYWVEVDIVELSNQQHVTWASDHVSESELKVAQIFTHQFTSGRVFFYDQGHYTMTMKLMCAFWGITSDNNLMDMVTLNLYTGTYPFQVTV